MIKDNSIIICSNKRKQSLLLKQIKEYPFYHIKYMDKHELLEKYYFSYDIKAICFLNDNYNLRYENAKEILDNLYNIKDISTKTKYLLEIKNKLDENHLLYYDNDFKNIFKNKNIYVDYSELDIEIKNILDEMNLKYEYLSNKSLNYKHDLYVFNNIDDEINFMFSKIGELINSGIDMNNIYIFGVSKEYEIKLNRYSQLFNIALEISNKIRLISSPAYKKFYKYLDTMDYLDAYKRLEEETKYDPNLALDSIANILVEINSLKIDKYKFKDLLNYMAKNKYLKAINYKSSIKKASIDTVIGDNDYVFMPGFSLSIYPTIHLDTMYLSDLELNKLNRLDSNIRNKIEHDILKSFILNTKNLIISFKNKNGKSKYYKSLLANELGLNEINNIDINTLYSNKLMKLEMVKYNDLYYRYGIDNKYRNSYHVDIDYYEKKYIKSDKLKNDDEIVLSSTQLSSYFSCPYKYFVERVLKLRTSDSTFNLELGNLFHKIIEDSFTKDINLEDYNDLINEKFKTNKEKILVNNVINQTLDVIKLNNEFRRIHSFNKIMIEEELKIEIDDKTKLVGKIDCYMIDDESNVIIVDFKSGKTKFDEKRLNMVLIFNYLFMHG